jgi:hypothetical protein
MWQTREYAEGFKSRHGKYPSGYDPEASPEIERPKTENSSDSARHWISDFRPSVQEEEKEPREPPLETQAEPQTATEGTRLRTAVRHRGPRRRIAPRAMPHGNCTGVWIPREIWEDTRFESTDERILYLEVNHLDREDGCTATNRHFAEYMGCSTQTVRDMIQDMTEQGIFTCSYPSRRSRIIHVVGGRQDYSRHRF